MVVLRISIQYLFLYFKMKKIFFPCVKGIWTTGKKSACFWNIQLDNLIDFNETQSFDRTIMMSFEANFFNIKTNIWTNLKSI